MVRPLIEAYEVGFGLLNIEHCKNVGACSGVFAKHYSVASMSFNLFYFSLLPFVPPLFSDLKYSPAILTILLYNPAHSNTKE